MSTPRTGADRRGEPSAARYGSRSSPRLNVVLEMFERPAAVVGADGRIVLSNTPFARFAGLPHRDSSVPFTDLVAPRSRPVWSAVLGRVAQGAASGSEATELEWASGGRDTVRLARIGRDDAPAALTVVGGAGASALALRHELAGPLTSVMGTVEMMLAAPEELPDELVDGLRRVLSECGRMTALLLAEERRGREGRS